MTTKNPWLGLASYEEPKNDGTDFLFCGRDDETLEMVRLLGDSGSLYENEKRVAFGLRPLPELEDIRMQSLNYVNTNIASQYQVGKGGAEDESNREDSASND